MTQNSNKSIVIWLFSGCFLIAAMVIVGGITRLTHSGLSMVEWKLIMGTIPPLNEEQWIETFEKYKQFPEYKIMHSHFTLADFKSIFIWEYLHRLLGRIVGLVFVIPFLVFLVKKKIDKSLLRQLLLIFIWGAFQGFLGWYMVKSGLVNNPNVSHYRLAIHLITAFGLCCYIFWVALGLMNNSKINHDNKAIINWGVGLLLLTMLQIIYGAFVAGLKAGYIHTTWPKMSGSWISPAIPEAFNHMGVSAIYADPVTIQFIHRWIAFAVIGLVIYIWVKLNRLELSQPQKNAKWVLLATLIIQVLLGILTLVFAIPIVLAVAHQLVALLLMLAVVNFIYWFK